MVLPEAHQPNTHIAIVGMGPRGVITFGRLVAAVRAGRSRRAVTVHLVDPRPFGTGCHPVDQPAFLLTNTLARQLTMFDEADPSERGPTFLEWARQSGYRWVDGDLVAMPPEYGRGIDDGDHLPRALLGQYVRWAYARHRQHAQGLLHIEEHRTTASALRREAVGFQLSLGNGGEVRADAVFLCLGHAEAAPDQTDRQMELFTARHAARSSAPTYVRNPYPVSALDHIGAAETVAVEGLGLTAYDVIAGLTEGRGGRFREAGERLVYLPSGREPRIRLFSRQSLPAAARASDWRGPRNDDDLHFFTVDRVRALKAARGAPLDFQRDLLPLLLCEMALAYRRAAVDDEVSVEGFRPSPQEVAVLRAAIDPLRGLAFTNFRTFRSRFIDELANDLIEAGRGNVASPIKAAVEVIRDCKPALSAAIEHNGLTPDSHRWYQSVFIPLTNRITFGPPRERNAQLMALLQKGIVDLGGGPDCCVVLDEANGRFMLTTRFPEGEHVTPAQHLVKARQEPFHPDSDLRPLVRQLIREGLARPLLNGDHRPGGFEVDPSTRAIGRNGQPTEGLWIQGHPAEGARSWAQAPARAGKAGWAFREADRALAEVFARAAELTDAPLVEVG